MHNLLCWCFLTRILLLLDFWSWKEYSSTGEVLRVCMTTSLLVQPPLQTMASADIYCGPFSLASISFCGFYSFPQCSTLGILTLLLILYHHHSLHADVMIPFVLFAQMGSRTSLHLDSFFPWLLPLLHKWISKNFWACHSQSLWKDLKIRWTNFFMFCASLSYKWRELRYDFSWHLCGTCWTSANFHSCMYSSTYLVRELMQKFIFFLLCCISSKWKNIRSNIRATEWKRFLSNLKCSA